MHLSGTNQTGYCKIYRQTSPYGCFIQKVTQNIHFIPFNAIKCCMLCMRHRIVQRRKKMIEITNPTDTQQADITEVSGPTQSGIFLGKKAEIIAGSLRTMLDYLRTAAFPFSVIYLFWSPARYHLMSALLLRWRSICKNLLNVTKP